MDDDERLTSLDNDTLSKENQFIGLLYERNRVRAEQSCFAGEQSVRSDDSIEEMSSDVSIDSREWIVCGYRSSAPNTRATAKDAPRR